MEHALLPSPLLGRQRERRTRKLNISPSFLPSASAEEQIRMYLFLSEELKSNNQIQRVSLNKRRNRGREGERKKFCSWPCSISGLQPFFLTSQ